MASNDWSFSPLGEFDRLRRQIDDVFGRFGFSPSLGVFPPLNIYDEDGRFLVAARLPGLKKESLNVEVRENVLTIAGAREPSAPEGAEVLRQECAAGEFRRNLRLPASVKNDAAEARFKDGILLVTIPKSEAAKPRQIAISA
jgi:HSP20 family protein